MRGHIEPTNLAMVYLLGVTFVASRYGRGEAIAASILAGLAFDLTLIPPYGTLAVANSQYLITLAAMMLVALVVSRLTLRLRKALEESADRERSTAALYKLSREMARSTDIQELAEVAAAEIAAVFDAEVGLLYAHAALVVSPTHFEEAGVAEWAHEHNEICGRDTNVFPEAAGLYIPVRGSFGPVGVLALLPKPDQSSFLPARRDLLDALANGLGLAMERAALARESREARFAAESQRIRNDLLSSISHDLRTPLTSIAGSASALVSAGAGELAETIYHESLRLNTQVQNLLDMTRLQSGAVEARLEWSSLEEIIGAALDRARELLGDRELTVETVPELPLLQLDNDLIVKLLVNLLENAAHHTPPTTRLWVTARSESRIVRVTVADDGPGVPKGQERAVFERFAQAGRRKDGLGLGLAICRAIMKLHRGVIWVQNRPSGGAEFHLEFPLPGEQPSVPVG